MQESRPRVPTATVRERERDGRRTETPAFQHFIPLATSLSSSIAKLLSNRSSGSFSTVEQNQSRSSLGGSTERARTTSADRADNDDDGGGGAGAGRARGLLNEVEELDLF